MEPLTIKSWCREITDWREGQGFTTPPDLEGENADWMLGKLMLVTSEIAEAAEACRDRDYENFKEELADAVIRIFDIAGTMKFDLELEIAAKMEVNRLRPRQHGRAIST